MILKGSYAKGESFTVRPILKCLKCGSRNFSETLTGMINYDPSKDTNIYECQDCGATGELKDLYNNRVKEE